MHEHRRETSERFIGMLCFDVVVEGDAYRRVIVLWERGRNLDEQRLASHYRKAERYLPALLGNLYFLS